MKAILSHIMTALLALGILAGCGAQGRTTRNDEARVTANPAATTAPRSGVGGVVNDAGNAVGSAVNGVGDAVGSAVNGVGDAVNDVVGGVGNAVGDVVNGAENAVGSVVGGTENAVNGSSVTPTPKR